MMLREALQIIRRLWSGGYQSFEGEYLTLEDARVLDLPDTPPPIIVAVGGKQAAAIAAELGDGMFATEPRSELTQAYAEAGGIGPKYTEVSLAVGSDTAAALKAAREKFRFSTVGWKMMSELPNPINFEAATQRVALGDMGQMISAGPDPEVHLAQVRTFTEAGFDHLALLNAGTDVDTFFDYYTRELAESLGAVRV